MMVFQSFAIVHCYVVVGWLQNGLLFGRFVLIYISLQKLKALDNRNNHSFEFSNRNILKKKRHGNSTD